MKRTTTWAKGLLAGLVLSTLVASAVQAQQKPVAAPVNVEWLQRPLEQVKHSPQDQVDFTRIQTECMTTSATDFGPQKPWQECRLVHSGFVATIGLQDFFYADYCLISKGDVCAKQAQVLFRNRAYRPEAFLDMARLDPPGTTYHSPVLVGSEEENVLATAVQLPGHRSLQRRYFRYADARWIPIDGQAWLAQLRTQLPAGLSVRVQPQDALPDPHTMMLSLPLYRAGDRACCARGGRVEVRLGIQAGQLEVAEFTLAQAGK